MNNNGKGLTMTHFATLVICKHPDDVERLLAPYDENLSIEEVTDEDGYTYSNNPRARWDWWVVGGRWPNLLMAHKGAETINPEPSAFGSNWDGVRTAGARKRDIDWEGMGVLQAEDARRTWAEAHGPEGAKWVEHDDPVVQVARMGFMYGIEPGDDETSYVQRRTAFTIGAIVTSDGEWHEQGQHGWWGHQDEGIGEAAWRAEVKRILDEAGDDDWLVIVDAHI